MPNPFPVGRQCGIWAAKPEVRRTCSLLSESSLMQDACQNAVVLEKPGQGLAQYYDFQEVWNKEKMRRPTDGPVGGYTKLSGRATGGTVAKSVELLPGAMFRAMTFYQYACHCSFADFGVLRCLGCLLDRCLCSNSEQLLHLGIAFSEVRVWSGL